MSEKGCWIDGCEYDGAKKVPENLVTLYTLDDILFYCCDYHLAEFRKKFRIPHSVELVKR